MKTKTTILFFLCMFFLKNMSLCQICTSCSLPSQVYPYCNVTLYASDFGCNNSGAVRYTWFINSGDNNVGIAGSTTGTSAIIYGKVPNGYGQVCLQGYNANNIAICGCCKQVAFCPPATISNFVNPAPNSTTLKINTSCGDFDYSSTYKWYIDGSLYMTGVGIAGMQLPFTPSSCGRIYKVKYERINACGTMVSECRKFHLENCDGNAYVVEDGLATDCGGSAVDNPNARVSKDTDEVLKSFTTFPNPSTGIFNLMFDNLNEKNIQMLDDKGIVVAEKTTKNKNIEIGNNNLLEGSYYIRVQIDGVIQTTKVKVFK